jgi:hypothetical protein
VAEAERAVSECEQRVEALRLELEDPHLYLTADGSRRAVDLGRELEAARRALDQAFARWDEATRAAERSG